MTVTVLEQDETKRTSRRLRPVQMKPQAFNRIEAMIRYLERHRQKLAAPDKIQIIFNCAGASVRVEKREFEQITDK